MRIIFVATDATAERIYYGTDTRIGAIALGVLTAILLHAWREKASPRTWWTRLAGSNAGLVVAVLLYLVSLLVRDDAFRGTLRYTLQAAAACIVIVAGLMPHRSRAADAVAAVSATRPVALIGVASYSIYLVHYSVIELISPLVAWLPAPARIISLTAAGVGAGLLVYTVVEVPALAWRKRMEERRRLRQST